MKPIVADSLPPYRLFLTSYDRLYRKWFGLDLPESAIAPLLRISLGHSRCNVTLTDGTSIRRGDRIAVLHFDNARVRALHAHRPSVFHVALEFYRQAVATLCELANLTEPGGRLESVRAFAATTIFHRRLSRFGFEETVDRTAWSRVVAAYQRALVASIHPMGKRPHRPAYARAKRLWLSASALRQLGHRRREGRSLTP